MPWFSININKVKTIRYYSSIDMAYLDHFSQKKWSSKITEVTIKPLNNKQLESFLFELLKETFAQKH